MSTEKYTMSEKLCSPTKTGQFPKQSLSGNKYIMVMVDIYSSGILIEPLKSRKDTNINKAYTNLMQYSNKPVFNQGNMC